MNRIVDLNKWPFGKPVATQLPARWVRPFWFMMGVLFATLMIWTWPAHASPSCMTHAEAREVWPREYLHWHGEHCWSGHSARSAHAEMRSVPLPKPKPFMLLLEQSEQPSEEWIYADRWWL